MRHITSPLLTKHRSSSGVRLDPSQKRSPSARAMPFSWATHPRQGTRTTRVPQYKPMSMEKNCTNYISLRVFQAFLGPNWWDCWCFRNLAIAQNMIKNLPLLQEFHISSLIIIFHQPRFPWNKGISLPKRYLLREIGRVFGRDFIWPDPNCFGFAFCVARLPKNFPSLHRAKPRRSVAWKSEAIWSLKFCWWFRNPAN